MARNILITGGAGFIGYHLSRYLLEAGGPDLRLTLVDNLQRGRLDADMHELLADPRMRFLQLDLTDQAVYKELGNGYDHVYHLAAVNGTNLFYEIPHEVLRINTLSLIYMLEWFRRENKEGKFLFTSSNEAYAGALAAFNQLPIPTPEAVPLVIEDTYNPRWTYAGTKLIGEQFMIHYAEQYKLRALIVRPHNFYGPRAGYSHVIPQFSLRIAERSDPFAIFGSTDTRTFCFIDDAVRAMGLLMDSEKTDTLPIETVHIGDFQEISMGDLLEKMFNVTGWRPKSVEVKNSVEGSVARRLGDVSKLQFLVDWKPKVSLEDGLLRTYEWYKKNPKK
ncbi:MAG: NAD-dependent epimerase/dehydratase family protein [Candidatus Magasanikbacteria bacterium]|nr:NAD-dependent epimerase/dehydratase family protein [Candidatus Magasanikbacteria bacterium]